MIKADVTDEYTKVEMEGSIIEISSDVCRMINSIHNSLFKDNYKAALMFRHFITQAVERDLESGLFRYDYDEGE